MSEFVSIIRLLANPATYHNKQVLVTGFLCLEFEGNALYLHEDDYRFGIFQNSVWIDVPDNVSRRRSEVDLRYVTVDATFDSKGHGHRGLFGGSINKVTRLWPCEERKRRR